ncbi:YigZ family protein [Sphaerisporangium rufum]|uniref:YigZ family protein n=1 Tax=Sphaerisporangium rufum TaxID=1381558 RepID=A0A919R7S2_9ACTN|nr:YigZ family protein [Sphaerisporangium rufum]GII78830.1 YigZ family protein [Sphaerisporangium rufum]
MPQPYLTVTGETEHEIEVRRSRFICALAPVGEPGQAAAFVTARRRAHHAARHTCSAYVLGGDRRTRRADDDGEPSGTAGAPMLEVLVRRGLADTIAVVTRYFGGVLLGAGGLVRAYGGAVAAALDRADLVTMVPARVVTVRVEHALAGRLENELRTAGHAVRGVSYGAEVTAEVGVGLDRLPGFAGWAAAVTAGRARVTPGPLVYVPAPA